jgi:hypothetical protein
MCRVESEKRFVQRDYKCGKCKRDDLQRAKVEKDVEEKGKGKGKGKGRDIGMFAIREKTAEA